MIWNPGDGSVLNEGGAGSDTVEVDGRRLRFEKALIATGSGPAVPNMPGLAAARYLTNETVFELTELPRRLVCLGAGVANCELAQAFGGEGGAPNACCRPRRRRRLKCCQNG